MKIKSKGFTENHKFSQRIERKILDFRQMVVEKNREFRQNIFDNSEFR